jgi:hypothetical protein
MPNIEKKKFIHWELATTSLLSAFQRGFPMYKKEVDGDHEDFKKMIKEELIKVGEECRAKPISEKMLLDYVENLIEKSKQFAPLLRTGELPFGRAQKAVNLYLKYLWCLDEIDTPPHCPIDAIVIRRAFELWGNRKIRDIQWTKMNKDQYDQIIIEINSHIKHSSLSEWELGVFNNRG